MKKIKQPQLKQQIMKYKEYFYVFILTIILILIYKNIDNIKVNAIVFMTLRRGIISQNCFWWRVNDFFPDSTGYEIYQRLKQRDRFVKLNILGKEIYLLTQLNDIKELLDFSPNPFGAGVLKKNFFSSFMKRNVGISDGQAWIERREYNDKVLETDKPHHMVDIFSEYINEIFYKDKPKQFSDFTEATRKITSKIIFGTYKYNDIIYKIFKQADSILSATFKVNFVDANDLSLYENYLKSQLHNPQPNTLLYLGHKYHKMLPEQDVIEQIPHWIFPIAGLFSVHLPRLLVLLLNHKEEFEFVKREIINKKYMVKDNYIRKCILELFRLNNAVNSTFRGLLEPYQFSNSEKVFEKNTEFVFFNNPVLRDLFDYPNEFVPSRWNEELENSYHALMFNQANQRCPGKELVISLLQAGCVSYLELCNFNLKTNIVLDKNYIPYLINPCTIKFTF
jgi:cytochrome P450